MKYKDLNPDIKANIITFTVSGLIIVLACFLLIHIQDVFAIIGSIFKVIMPFIFGFCIAFVLSPVQHIVEDKWLKGTSLKPRTKRKIAVAVSMLFLILFFTLFFSVLIPQLYDSAVQLGSSMDGYMESAQGWFSALFTYNPDVYNFITFAIDSLETVAKDFIANLSTYIPTIVSASYSVISTIVNFLIGLIVAVYILVDRERFKRQVKKVLYATLPTAKVEKILDLGRLTSHMCNKFIFGKILDSVIVGLVCLIITSIFGIPYSPLISFIIGITNVIPVFGPFIGAIPCIFILLIIDPFAALWFFIFIIILQQIDGNILGPYILGDSMGLPSLWVMFAIIVGGGFFGIVGMIIGVPLFSVIYSVIKTTVTKRLEEKKIEIV